MTLQKCLQKKFAKFGFRVEKHNFCKKAIGFLPNSPDPFPKIGFRKKLFSQFLRFFRYPTIFAKK
jgi:hypothetical protein